MGDKAEIHAEGAKLIGYHGDERPERAHVIIGSSQLDSASNDIGSAPGAGGCFRAILSESGLGFQGHNGRWLPGSPSWQALSCAAQRAKLGWRTLLSAKERF